MDGIIAGLDQIKDAIQSRHSTGNRESCLGRETQFCQAYDVSEIETLKAIVVRDIQEDGVRHNARPCHGLILLPFDSPKQILPTHSQFSGHACVAERR